MLIWCKSELDWLQNIYLTWKNGEKILGGLEWQASDSQYMAAFVQMHVSPQSASKDASCQIGKEPELIDEDLDDLKYSKMAKHIGDFEVKPYDHREDNKA